MKRTAYLLLLLSFLSTSSAYAEYCWMIGCKGLVGYISTYITKNGKTECIFESNVLPKEGSEAILKSFVNMSQDPSTKPEEGPYVLGSGFVVQILDYVGKNQEIARIKIISDDLK